MLLLVVRSHAERQKASSVDLWYNNTSISPSSKQTVRSKFANRTFFMWDTHYSNYWLATAYLAKESNCWCAIQEATTFSIQPGGLYVIIKSLITLCCSVACVQRPSLKISWISLFGSLIWIIVGAQVVGSSRTKPALLSGVQMGTATEVPSVFRSSKETIRGAEPHC